MLWNYGLKNLKLAIKWFEIFLCFEIFYGSKNIKNSYISYTYVLKNYLEFIVVILYLLDKLETGNEKWEMRLWKWEMITYQYNLLFLNFLFVNNMIMASHIKNLLKQLPFYEKTIKSWIEKFTNAKLLSELPFFEKPIKAKIKQLSIKKLLSK